MPIANKYKEELKEEKRSLSTREKDMIITMRGEKQVEEEDGSVLEAEQTNLSLSPHLGEGVVLRLFAESEHLSFDSLPQTCQSLLPTDRELPSAELLTHP